MTHSKKKVDVEGTEELQRLAPVLTRFHANSQDWIKPSSNRNEDCHVVAESSSKTDWALSLKENAKNRDGIAPVAISYSDIHLYEEYLKDVAQALFAKFGAKLDLLNGVYGIGSISSVNFNVLMPDGFLEFVHKRDVLENQGLGVLRYMPKYFRFSHYGLSALYVLANPKREIGENVKIENADFAPLVLPIPASN